MKDESGFEAAGLLSCFNARVGKVMQATLPKTPMARYVAKGKLRERVSFGPGGLAFFWFSRGDINAWRATQEDSLSFMNELRGIDEVSVTAAYYEEENRWHCSIRSGPGTKVDARRLASACGGGGHAHAAAFDSNEAPAAVFEKLKSVILENV